MAVAYVLFAKGLEKLPASSVATLTLAEPLTAATLGVVILGERPGAVAGLGALLVLSGLLISPTGAATAPIQPDGVDLPGERSGTRRLTP